MHGLSKVADVKEWAMGEGGIHHVYIYIGIYNC